MTLLNTPNVKRHAGNDTTGPWDYPYYYADENDIEFRYRLADGTEGVFDPSTDYTRISGGPGEENGSVYQTTNAVATGTKLAIQAKTPAQQTKTPDEINRFRAQEFEAAFDRQALTTRRHADDVDRALVSSPIDPGGDKLLKNMIQGFLLRVESVVDNPDGTQTVLIDGGNAQSQDLANPGNYVSRDGSQPPTADMPWNNKKITGLADGVADTDAATVLQTKAAYTKAESDARFGRITEANTWTGTQNTFEDGITIGKDTGGDSVAKFYDDTNDTTRDLYWNDGAGTFYGDDSSGTGWPIGFFYSGGNANNASFPLGATVFADGGGAVLDRNVAQTVRLDTGSTSKYVLFGAGTALTGTWRSSGFVAGTTNLYVLRRVA